MNTPPRPSPSPTFQRALALYESGRAAEAEALLAPYLRRTRDDGGALGIMAQIHYDRGRLPQCEFVARQALALSPANATLLIMLARALWAQNRSAEARPLAVRATEAAPGSHHAWGARAHIAVSLRDHAEAIMCYERSLALNPDQNESALVGLAQTLGGLGRRAQAATLLRAGCAAQPLNPRLAAELASTLNYVSGVGADDVAEAHFEIGRRLARHAPLPLPPPAFTPDPHKRLRVGLISGDLRTHAVAFYLEPILAHRDAAGIEYIAFSTCADNPADPWHARVRASTSGWHNLVGADELAATRLILRERLDMLIDLAGHTHLSGIWLMRSRLAPVQMTYLGYPHSTGLRTIDYRLVSTATDPPGFESQAVERLLRLDPCMHAFAPPSAAPEPADPGTRRPGPVRFGSFNNAGKVSALTLDLWARVLAGAPGSTLTLKSDTLGDAASWAFLLDELYARGIERARVCPLPRAASFTDHLALYHDIDIALDTTPYNGTTTTCEALWMGVPVVALWGDRHAARVGGALLSAAGVPDLCADADEAYEQLALALAADDERRARYRRALRPTLAASVLCDGPAMARRFEGALRRAWHDRCAAPPGTSPRPAVSSDR